MISAWNRSGNRLTIAEDVRERVRLRLDATPYRPPQGAGGHRNRDGPPRGADRAGSADRPSPPMPSSPRRQAAKRARACVLWYVDPIGRKGTKFSAPKPPILPLVGRRGGWGAGPSGGRLWHPARANAFRRAKGGAGGQGLKGENPFQRFAPKPGGIPERADGVLRGILDFGAGGENRGQFPGRPEIVGPRRGPGSFPGLEKVSGTKERNCGKRPSGKRGALKLDWRLKVQGSPGGLGISEPFLNLSLGGEKFPNSPWGKSRGPGRRGGHQIRGAAKRGRPGEHRGGNGLLPGGCEPPLVVEKRPVCLGCAAPGNLPPFYNIGRGQKRAGEKLLDMVGTKMTWGRTKEIFSWARGGKYIGAPLFIEQRDGERHLFLSPGGGGE